MTAVESCEINGLRKAVRLLEAYMSLGPPEELQNLCAQVDTLHKEAEVLRLEIKELQTELASRHEVIETLNRRIEWMQRYVKERSSK